MINVTTYLIHIIVNIDTLAVLWRRRMLLGRGGLVVDFNGRTVDAPAEVLGKGEAVALRVADKGKHLICAVGKIMLVIAVSSDSITDGGRSAEHKLDIVVRIVIYAHT